MASNRGKVLNEDAQRWVGGQLPTAEYYAKVYEEERKRARDQVAHTLSVRRRRRLRSVSNET